MDHWKSLRRSRGESGQAVVEAAIVLPAMIFLLLLTIQLTMLQQARLAVEYAAFSAARAGVVLNGNNGSSNGTGPDSPMRNAAVMAILPTFGRADSVASLLATQTAFELQDAKLRGPPLDIPQVRVAVLNPHQSDFKTQTHLNGKEIDFDDIRPAVAPSTLLSVQVRYYYQLRVPFANKMIQAIWMASQVGVLRNWQGWDLTAPKLNNSQTTDAVSMSRAMALGKGNVPDGTPEGINVRGLVLASSGARPQYFLPVDAWYTMRMQSNPYLKWAAP
jgi:hypothetical protein